VLGIASARHGEGRTTVALGLASSLAEMFYSVVLVEMEDEAEGPLLCEELGIPLGAGVGDYVLGNACLEEILHETGRPNLKLVASGQTRLRGGRLESTSRIRELLADLRERFEVVVVDLPPVLENEQAPALLGQLDGVVLVVNSGSTTSDDVSLTTELCEGIPVRGVLLNRQESRTPKWLATLVKS
jgi:Mrp family chromosome partitioning ATPase